ncbi:hypothetical protein KC332_g11554 [Hortaea werneckii]|nr:hypothetical protein KC358_g11463 [Hortaea werneckii]KAI6815883.1 hypothetical protein KC350_g10911 [Hortaea werneckii]KAI6915795.1 hypothetical protein KC348_g11850 [Hortaea werneckii]KAI6928541.1 hypothetical protein KC341_g11447 [Hortaea werneckii]KAI6963021.1 hypothetical protein KC321_g11452 [Hortaea werneckii]
MSTDAPPAAARAADTVINDFYNQEDYVRRRAGFLGRHDDYKGRAVFPIARGDAKRVFTDEREILSVQEVQRRETAAEIEDLLPLPTTANTQTIDNFKSYPDSEWATNNYPVEYRPDPPESPSAQPSPVESVQPSAVASARASRASSALSGEDTDEDEGEVGVSALSGRSINVPVKKQVHFDGPPTPPEREDSDSQSDSSGRESISQSGSSSSTATATAPQTSRSRKRPAADLDGTDENTATVSTTSPRATKAPRLKSNNARKPQRVLQDEDDDDDDDEEGEEEKDEDEEDEAFPGLEAIIAGTRLPANRAEALRASHIRRGRIGDQQPEFFTPEAFPDDGQVRCVCGLTENDDMPMTACEGCDVWQHIACVGPAYYEEMADYFCQMCDPFVHRELVARLRREG